MAKSDQNEARQTARNLAGSAQQQTGAVINGLNTSVTGNTGQQQNTLDIAKTGLQQQQITGGYDPSQLGTLRDNAAKTASTGGYDPDAVGALQTGYQKAVSTGGYDQGTLDYLKGAGQQFASSGGYDPTKYNQLSAGYKDFADTGGFSDRDKSQFINQATSGVKNTYDVLANQAELNRNKTGGLGTGGDQSQLARQLSQQQASATLGAQTNLHALESQNKLAGLAGGTGLETSAAAGRLNSLGTMTSLAGTQAGNTVSALNGASNLTTNQAAGIRAGVGQQQNLESGVATGSNNANSVLSSLYNTETNQITAQGQQILTALGLNFSTQEDALRTLTGLANTPGILDNITRIGGMVSGGLTGLAGAMKGKG